MSQSKQPDFAFNRSPETERPLKEKRDNFPDWVTTIDVVQENPNSSKYYVLINNKVVFQPATLNFVADWLEEGGFNTLAQWAHEKYAREGGE